MNCGKDTLHNKNWSIDPKPECNNSSYLPSILQLNRRWCNIGHSQFLHSLVMFFSQIFFMKMLMRRCNRCGCTRRCNNRWWVRRLMQRCIDFTLQIWCHIFDDRASRTQLYNLCGRWWHLIAVFVYRIVVVNELVTGWYCCFGAVYADALIRKRICWWGIVLWYTGIV